MNKAEKEAEIETIGRLLADKAAICADYRGLSVNQITTLRQKLNEIGATGKVLKNTLGRLSVERSLNGGSEQFKELFNGPSMLMSGPDAAQLAKVVSNFAKANSIFSVKGAWVEEFVDAQGVDALSKLPSKEELLGQLLRVFNAPATQVVRLLNAPAQQIVGVLAAFQRKLESEG